MDKTIITNRNRIFMEKNLYIDASHPDETRIVLKSENYIEEYEYENKNKLYLKNNIYLGKVSRIEPSLQAAFVNYGRQRHGFLAFSDIQSDYYQIPHDDKYRLKKEEENLRLELKEKNHNAEEVEKIQDRMYLIRLLQITIIMKLILMKKKIKMKIHQCRKKQPI